MLSEKVQPHLLVLTSFQGNDELADKFGPDFIKNANALAQMDLLEQCFHESIRLAQQSLTLR